MNTGALPAPWARHRGRPRAHGPSPGRDYALGAAPPAVSWPIKRRNGQSLRKHIRNKRGNPNIPLILSENAILSSLAELYNPTLSNLPSLDGNCPTPVKKADFDTHTRTTGCETRGSTDPPTNHYLVSFSQASPHDHKCKSVGNVLVIAANSHEEPYMTMPNCIRYPPAEHGAVGKIALPSTRKPPLPTHVTGPAESGGGPPSGTMNEKSREKNDMQMNFRPSKTCQWGWSPSLPSSFRHQKK